MSLKVVDRRFWARQREGAQAGDPAGDVEEHPTRPSVLQELQKRLDQTQARLREAVAGYQALQKGNDDFRQRLSRDQERRVALAKADLFRGMLEVADNLERALDSAPAPPTALPAAPPDAGAPGSGAEPDAAPGAGAEALSRGVAQVLAQIRRLLASEGVEEVAVMEQPFDPNVAEAIEVRETPEPGRDGVVIEVTQRGYQYSGQTLRPARVVVGRAAGALPAPPDAPSQGSIPAD